MGLPNNVLSDVDFYATWNGPVQSDPTQYTDSCLGGADINNPAGGSQYQVWTFDTDGANVFASSPATGRKNIFTPGVSIESIRCCFDQNMHPFVCYLSSNQWNYWWYDTTIPGPATSQLPATVNSVACTLDDKRPWSSTVSDICLLYTNNNNLYYRRQRDRYGTEYLLRSSVNGILIRASMNNLNRLQLKMQANLL